MGYVRETLVTTKNRDQSIKVSPLGVYIDNKILKLKPFKPSKSLENIIRNGSGVINYVDDVRIFASCITNRKIQINFEKVSKIDCSRIKNAISHTEFIVKDILDHNERPTIVCNPINEETHKMFYGFNRAKSAIIELCILVSRLGIIEDNKIKNEIEYLKIAIEKTAGQNEYEAWYWLIEHIKNYKEDLIKNV